MMIKLVVIDDETDIREGIKYSLDCINNDLLIVGEASNGIEAIDIINKTFPDIIIVDIRMPLMNGLQLIESIASTHPYIKSIIISGYDDFDYAKKALKLGASDYLLKPCGPDEILEAILKVKKLIEKERKEKEIIQTYMEGFSESHEFIKAKYLTSLIDETASKDSLLLDKFELMNLNILRNNFVLLVLRIDCYNTLIQEGNSNAIDLIKYGIINVSKEVIGTDYKCEAFEYNDDIIIVLNTEPVEKLNSELLVNLKTEIKKYLNLTISIGVSNFGINIDELHSLYKQAFTAVEYRFFKGDYATIYYSDVQSKSSNNNAYPLNLENQIINSISVESEDQLYKNYNSFFEFLVEKYPNKEHILKACMSVLFSIHHLALENNVDENEIMKKIDTLSEISKFGTINQLKREVYQIILMSYEKINHSMVGNKFVKNAINYIQENYDKDISLESVAKNIFITPSYVSVLFKQVLGVNFVEYLHKFRLNKACGLMKNKNLKVYEIAYMVGYNDDKYFSQIFKKYLGLTPCQYRETII